MTPCAGRSVAWITCGKRPRHDFDPDPQREKKRRIRWEIRARPRRSVVLAQDETDLLLLPPLRAGWSKRGQVAKVWWSGRNARRVIFGVILVDGNTSVRATPEGSEC